MQSAAKEFTNDAPLFLIQGHSLRRYDAARSGVLSVEEELAVGSSVIDGNRSTKWGCRLEQLERSPVVEFPVLPRYRVLLKEYGMPLLRVAHDQVDGRHPGQLHQRAGGSVVRERCADQHLDIRQREGGRGA